MLRSISIKSLFVVVSTLVLSTNAQAAIIDLGNITRDTNTGLDWLDVTETRGLSYNQVISQMGAGGTYEGWQYATGTEVAQLINNFGYVPESSCTGWSGVPICDVASSQSELIETMILTLGDTFDAYLDSSDVSPFYSSSDISATGAGQLKGLLGEVLGNPAPGFVSFVTIQDAEIVDRASGAFISDANDKVTMTGIISTNGIAGSLDQYGSFLVAASGTAQAPSTVPVPAAAWLFGSGLLGLVGMARRKY